MLIVESVRDIFQIITEPLQDLFGFFPDFALAFEGLILLFLGYCGWRAIK